ncbi:MAG: response regulator [Saprospiraceae bacterium]|nr:response regulator [Saprospiraceae bacterium]
MSTLKAIIIDDEVRNRELLKLMLAEHCPTVRVVGQAANITEGVRLTKSQKPDIVFLDIRLSNGDEGFDFFNHFPPSKSEFEVVFVTAREEYVFRAFNQTFAIGYILKPIDPDELISIVFKIKQKLLLTQQPDKFIDDTYNSNDVMFIFIKDETVRLHFVDGREKIAKSNTLEEYEHLRTFVRANRQYVVNLAFVNKVTDIDAQGDKLRGAIAVLYNNHEISISVNRKSHFIRSFVQFS